MDFHKEEKVILITFNTIHIRPLLPHIMIYDFSSLSLQTIVYCFYPGGKSHPPLSLSFITLLYFFADNYCQFCFLPVSLSLCFFTSLSICHLFIFLFALLHLCLSIFIISLSIYFHISICRIDVLLDIWVFSVHKSIAEFL